MAEQPSDTQRLLWMLEAVRREIRAGALLGQQDDAGFQLAAEETRDADAFAELALGKLENPGTERKRGTTR